MVAVPKSGVLPVHCSATGTKFFAPAMTSTDVCARFVRALSTGTSTGAVLSTAQPTGDGLVVELHFLPQGVASARAARWHAGRSLPLPVYEVAISDRQFAATDIDRLAGDVARGIALKPASARKG